jgi:hypothetical protein
VPDVFCNGEELGYQFPPIPPAYEAAKMLTSYIEVASSFSITGESIELTTNILPWDDYGSVRVHNVVCEKKTTGNVGGNGETEFHHVMMDMIPNANGATVNLQYGTPVQLSYTVDLSGTFIEEFDDLLVSIMVQNYSSKEIYQSAYAREDYDYSPEDRLSMIYLDGDSLEGFDPEVYEYNVVLPEGTQFEPFLEAVTMHDSARAIVNPAFELPGTATVDVYAENLYNNKRYIVNYTVFTGIDDMTTPLIQVFPNPVNGTLNIAGLKDASVKLFSTNGTEVISLTGFSGSSIDISRLPAGIYILNITTLEGNTARKKIVVY